jgi:uncharacterized membrane protein YdbT with pleckstrin-like domain
MGYVDDSLLSDEAVTYRARLHWMLFFKPALITIVVIAIAGLIHQVADLGKVLSTQTDLLVWIAVLVIAALPLLTALLRWQAADLAVTNKRVILKTGVLKLKTPEMFLNRIESVEVDQSIAGRVFGFGTIVIRGTGGSLEPFHKVSHPLRFRNQIQEQIGRPVETHKSSH